MTTIDNRKDILLLLLYSPGRGENSNEPITGRTRLVKMLFLFKEEALPYFKHETDIPEDEFYEFFPWNFGPFSRDVYDDLTFFTLRGFVEANEVEENTLPESAAEWEEWLSLSGSSISDESISEYQEESFRLTEKGCDFAKQLYETLSSPQRKLLREFKKRTSIVPLQALLQYVYENYENMTTRSTIKEQVLGTG
ncbi:MAG: hypothetical protein K8S55_00490 [Phycisphaerae bacterium]|nr:hypothetical protein [Phycisphaerae bacterium]